MDFRLLFTVEWFRDKAIEDRNVLSHRCDVKDTCIVTRVNAEYSVQCVIVAQHTHAFLEKAWLAGESSQQNKSTQPSK